MTNEERARAALIRAAAASWGEEAAVTLSELLPPDGERPATRRDIQGVLAAMTAMDDRHEARFAAIEEQLDRLVVGVDERLVGVGDQLVAVDDRLVAVDDRLVAVDDRLVGVDDRLVGVDDRLGRIEDQFDVMDERFGLKLESSVDRITAVFERRISDGVSMQTRTLVFSQLGALVVIAALAFGLR